MSKAKDNKLLKILRNYRINAESAYSEVLDGVHTKEEYWKALDFIGERAVEDIKAIFSNKRVNHD